MHDGGRQLFNALYLIPKFAELFHLPIDQIVAMGTAVNKGITSVPTLVLFAVVPFNLIKGIVDSALTYLLYKRVEFLLFPELRKKDKVQPQVQSKDPTRSTEIATIANRLQTSACRRFFAAADAGAPCAAAM